MATNHRNDDDDRLIYRSFYGDKEAFGELYERYLRDIFRFIYYRVANEEDAEDLTELVFLQAWESLPLVHLQGFNFKAWVYRIAHNKVIDRYRTAHPAGSLNEREVYASEVNEPEIAFQINEMTRNLAVAISKLDSTYQDVLIYRFILELSHQETAEIMDRSIVHVRVLQHRAISKLREWYKEEQRNHG